MPSMIIKKIESRELGNMIREARIKSGKSQSELAEKLGCSQQNISLIENGLRSASIGMLRRIAIALNKKLINPKIK